MESEHDNNNNNIDLAITTTTALSAIDEEFNDIDPLEVQQIFVSSVSQQHGEQQQQQQQQQEQHGEQERQLQEQQEQEQQQSFYDDVEKVSGESLSGLSLQVPEEEVWQSTNHWMTCFTSEGHVYYYCLGTNESQWTFPEGENIVVDALSHDQQEQLSQLQWQQYFLEQQQQQQQQQQEQPQQAGVLDTSTKVVEEPIIVTARSSSSGMNTFVVDASTYSATKHTQRFELQQQQQQQQLYSTPIQSYSQQQQNNQDHHQFDRYARFAYSDMSVTPMSTTIVNNQPFVQQQQQDYREQQQQLQQQEDSSAMFSQSTPSKNVKKTNNINNNINKSSNSDSGEEEDSSSSSSSLEDKRKRHLQIWSRFFSNASMQAINSINNNNNTSLSLSQQQQSQQEELRFSSDEYSLSSDFSRRPKKSIASPSATTATRTKKGSTSNMIAKESRHNTRTSIHGWPKKMRSRPYFSLIEQAIPDDDDVAAALMESSSLLSSSFSLSEEQVKLAQLRSEALLVSCHRRDLEVMELLLLSGVDTNAVDDVGRTASHYACYRINNNDNSDDIDDDDDDDFEQEEKVDKEDLETTSILSLLYHHGAEVDQEDAQGRTPLHVALEYRKHKNVEFLLKCAVSINAQDVNGDTPLHVAARSGNQKLVRLCVLYGADCYLVNHQGLNAHDSASQLFPRSAKLQESIDYLKKKMHSMAVGGTESSKSTQEQKHQHRRRQHETQSTTMTAATTTALKTSARTMSSKSNQGNGHKFPPPPVEYIRPSSSKKQLHGNTTMSGIPPPPPYAPPSKLIGSGHNNSVNNNSSSKNKAAVPVKPPSSFSTKANIAPLNMEKMGVSKNHINNNESDSESDSGSESVVSEEEESGNENILGLVNQVMWKAVGNMFQNSWQYWANRNNSNNSSSASEPNVMTPTKAVRWEATAPPTDRELEEQGLARPKARNSNVGAFGHPPPDDVKVAIALARAKQQQQLQQQQQQRKEQEGEEEQRNSISSDVNDPISFQTPSSSPLKQKQQQQQQRKQTWSTEEEYDREDDSNSTNSGSSPMSPQENRYSLQGNSKELHRASSWRYLDIMNSPTFPNNK